MFIAACLSAKESFTSTLTSEPAIQWRRHELAGIANVSAQSELLLSHRLTHSLALWPLLLATSNHRALNDT